jgi:hypothetical protein
MRPKRITLYAACTAFGLTGAYLMYLFLWADKATDVSDYLRHKIKEAPLSRSRVYLDDLARHEHLPEWSQACLVLPYAHADASKIAPEALRRTSWVGNWDESEWRIAFLASGEVVSAFVVKFDAVRLVETEPFGIVCASRNQRPSLRSIVNRSRYSVELGTE